MTPSHQHLFTQRHLKNVFVAIFACLAINPAVKADFIDFSDLTLAPNSYWNGSSNTGGFSSGGAYFNNSYYYDTTYNYESWTGWAQSNITDNTTAGYTNQYSAITGAGVLGAGSNYLIADDYDLNDSLINFPSGTRPLALNITNTTYAYYSMLNGDSFAKKFTNSDWFMLRITGYDSAGATGSATGSVDFYLAQNLKFVNSWTNVSLSGLAANTRSLGFELTSSDSGVYGMNTPAYFALGSIQVTSVPEPSTFITTAITVGAFLIVRHRGRRIA